jgi:hypothetical protein
MGRPPKSLAVTFANWRHLVLHLKIYRREQIASEPRGNKRARNGRLHSLQMKFPVPANKFPVPPNIFPVNLRGELREK